MELRVLIVSDDPLTRSALSASLSDWPEVLVVGDIGSTDGLTDVLAAEAPDVLVWDTGGDPATHPDQWKGASSAGASCRTSPSP